MNDSSDGGWPCLIVDYNCIYAWFQFTTDRDSDDLLPELLSDIPVGDGGLPSSFLPEEMIACGWDSIFPTQHLCVEWALHHGIAPYQPFCLKITLKVYGPDCHGEYDASVKTELISIESMNPEWVLREWEKYLRLIWGGLSADFPAEFVQTPEEEPARKSFTLEENVLTCPG